MFSLVVDEHEVSSPDAGAVHVVDAITEQRSDGGVHRTPVPLEQQAPANAQTSVRISTTQHLKGQCLQDTQFLVQLVALSGTHFPTAAHALASGATAPDRKCLARAASCTFTCERDASAVNTPFPVWFPFCKDRFFLLLFRAMDWAQIPVNHKSDSEIVSTQTREEL